MPEVEELIERLETTADACEQTTRFGNPFFGSVAHIKLFREAAQALTVSPKQIEAATKTFYGDDALWEHMSERWKSRQYEKARKAIIELGLKVE